MHAIRRLMDPRYAIRTMRDRHSDFNYDVNNLTMLSWADPFRPDGVLPEHVRKAAEESLRSGGMHYTLPFGSEELRCLVAERVQRCNGITVDPERNLTICGGSDAALVFALRPFMTPGENNEVLTPTPSYANNFDTAALCGGVCVPVPTREKDGYQLDINEFERRMSRRTRAVMLTSPNNPTGTVYRRETLEALADFVRSRDLVLIVDQCFEDTVFDGHKMVNIINMPGMFERTVLIGSLSKGMGLCGLRIGYIVANDEISDVYHSCTVQWLGVPNTMAQAAAAAALRHPEFVEQYRQEYMARAKEVCAILADVPGLHYIPPESGFSLWIDVSRYGDAEAVVQYLAHEAGVLLSAGAPFGSEYHVRLIFAAMGQRSECMEAVQRVRKALLRYPLTSQPGFRAAGRRGRN